jgi:peptidoglycan hydrolase CwlO-like protein
MNKSWLQKNTKNIIIGVILAVAVSFLVFKGNSYYKSYETLLETLKNEKDSILNDSRVRVDSLKSELSNSDDRLFNLENLLSEKQRQNNYLYDKLKQREKDLLVRDISFINNARRIAEYTNRYYSQNDTVR